MTDPQGPIVYGHQLGLLPRLGHSSILAPSIALQFPKCVQLIVPQGLCIWYFAFLKWSSSPLHPTLQHASCMPETSEHSWVVSSSGNFLTHCWGQLSSAHGSLMSRMKSVNTIAALHFSARSFHCFSQLTCEVPKCRDLVYFHSSW